MNCVLDVTFREDGYRVLKAYATSHLSALHKFALSAFDKVTTLADLRLRRHRKLADHRLDYRIELYET